VTVDWDLVGNIAAPLIALVAGAFLNRLMESRPRLLTYLGHVGDHMVKGENGNNQHIYTHSVVVRNAGRKRATNVRLSHPYLPSFNVHPDVQHHVSDLPGGGREITFPVLVPNEQITISYLYFPPITWSAINGPIRSDEGIAKVLHVLLTQQYPRWFNGLAAGLMLVGLMSILYVMFVVGRILLIMDSTA
jgi:hypothetical protein